MAAVEIQQSSTGREPGTSSSKRAYSHSHPVPAPGCYVPAITFYQRNADKLDLDAQAKYYSYLASTGLQGLVILGTNAETFLLTRDERKTLLQLARRTVPRDTPIIAGVGGHSTAQVLEYIQHAYEAGSDFVLLLPCAYFGKQTTPAVVKDFFNSVAKQSPLPIVSQQGNQCSKQHTDSAYRSSTTSQQSATASTSTPTSSKKSHERMRTSSV